MSTISGILSVQKAQLCAGKDVVNQVKKRSFKTGDEEGVEPLTASKDKSIYILQIDINNCTLMSEHLPEISEVIR